MPAAKKPAPKAEPKIIGHCMKCKTKRRIAGPKLVTMKNGARAVKGTCVKCKGGMFKFVPRKKAAATKNSDVPQKKAPAKTAKKKAAPVASKSKAPRKRAK